MKLRSDCQWLSVLLSSSENKPTFSGFYSLHFWKNMTADDARSTTDNAKQEPDYS